MHEAIGDQALRGKVERMIRDEAASTIVAGSEQDLVAYSDALLRRFDNPALRHRFAQIATDGSQKIPQRWLATLAARQAHGLYSPIIESAVEAWIQHIATGHDVNDPLAADIRNALALCSPGTEREAIFGEAGPLRSDWQPSGTAQQRSSLDK